MDEFVIRLNGKPKEYVDRFIEKGYFNTKSEIIRLGIMELASKYKIDDPSYEEVTLVNKAIKKEMNKIKTNKTKVHSQEEFLNLFPHLKKVKLWFLLYDVIYSDDFKNDLLKQDKLLQIIIYKKILKISFETLISRKHLMYGQPYFVEKISESSRLVYNISENKLYIIWFFRDHKDYEKWYKS